MGKPDVVGWFDENWMGVREQGHVHGWESLSRPDQVFLAVGFLLDSCIGDGVWAIVDGVVEDNDEGLTVHMPDALEAIGCPEAAEHIRAIVRLRAPTGSEDKDASNRKEALSHWRAIGDLFEEWDSQGERVMLLRLYEWYHAQQSTKG